MVLPEGPYGSARCWCLSHQRLHDHTVHKCHPVGRGQPLQCSHCSAAIAVQPLQCSHCSAAIAVQPLQCSHKSQYSWNIAVQPIAARCNLYHHYLPTLMARQEGCERQLMLTCVGSIQAQLTEIRNKKKQPSRRQHTFMDGSALARKAREVGEAVARN
jgi:hypothetical protein